MPRRKAAAKKKPRKKPACRCGWWLPASIGVGVPKGNGVPSYATVTLSCPNCGKPSGYHIPFHQKPATESAMLH